MREDVEGGGTGIDHLLQPSLTQLGRQLPLYSVRAGFMVAFFGGGIASVLFTALNSQRLGRLARDAWWLLLGVVAFASLGIWTSHLARTGGELPWLGPAVENARELRYLNRALALAFFGLAYQAHRPYYKAAEFAGQTPPNPWGPGLVIAVLGVVAALAFHSLASFVPLLGASR